MSKSKVYSVYNMVKKIDNQISNIIPIKSESFYLVNFDDKLCLSLITCSNPDYSILKVKHKALLYLLQKIETLIYI